MNDPIDSPHPGLSTPGFSSKVAVVTGGTRGIGRAIANGLASRGARVIVASRDAATVDKAARQLVRDFGYGKGIACDVSKPAALDALFAAAKAEGGVDCLVHCAGLSSVVAAESASRQELMKMADVHYLAAVDLAQRSYHQMVGKGGSILFISSIWSLGGQPASIAYGAAKAAMNQAMRVMAVEWARHDIRVNALAPGHVKTDMTKQIPKDVADKLIKRVPMRRMAEAEEMVEPALFLLGKGASYITGQILAVDGGERAR